MRMRACRATHGRKPEKISHQLLEVAHGRVGHAHAGSRHGQVCGRGAALVGIPDLRRKQRRTGCARTNAQKSPHPLTLCSSHCVTLQTAGQRVHLTTEWVTLLINNTIELLAEVSPAYGCRHGTARRRSGPL